MCTETALCILSYTANPSLIARMTEDEFVSIIGTHYQGRCLKRKKLRALHQVAKSSIGILAGAQSTATEIYFMVEKLNLIKKHIYATEEMLVRLVDKAEESKYLLLITGLNYIAVAGLIAEPGCFKAYRTSKQMIKMAGSNPTESESAGKRSARTPMSKQGRPVLRYCAWTSVIPMLRFNADFRAWAKKRRERPAHANPLGGREIVGAALNKLLRLAFALVKNQTLYHPPQLALVNI